MTLSLERVEMNATPDPRFAPNDVAVVIPGWLRLASATWTWIGVAAVILGFGLIALTWGFVSGEGQVFRQLPYLVSGGLSGLGLIVALRRLFRIGERD